MIKPIPILTVLIFASLHSYDVFSQLSQYCIGTPGNELATKVCYIPADSSTIIAGYTYDYTSGTVSNCQAVLLKVTNAGVIAWQKTFGVAAANNIIQDMIITDDTNIVVVGLVGRGATPYTNNYAAIIKFNSRNGNIIWEKCFRDAVTTTGGEILTGVTEMTDGTKRLVAVGAHNMTPVGDAMICVFQSNGAFAYGQLLGISNGDEFNSVTPSASGNSVYMCGEFDGNYKDGRIISYTPGATSGTINWSQYFDFSLFGTLQDNYFNRIFLSGSKLVAEGTCIQGWTSTGGVGHFVMTLNASDGTGGQVYGLRNGGTNFANAPTLVPVSSDHMFAVQSPSTAAYDPTAWLSGVSTDAEVTEITSLSGHIANAPVKFNTVAAGQHSILDLTLNNNSIFLAGSTNISSGYGNNDIYYVAGSTSLASNNHTCDTTHDVISIVNTPFTGTPPTYTNSLFTPTYITVDTANARFSIRLLCGDAPVDTTPQLCNTLSMMDTVVVCRDGTIAMPATISGSDSIVNILWSPATGLSATTLLNPMLTATTSRWYRLTVESLLPGNLVANGDFAAGNAGFLTSYTVESPATVSTPGYYAVDVNPTSYDASWPSMGDHTTGTGNMLIVDGAPAAGRSFWCESMPVTPGTSYVFSIWLALLHAPTPTIELNINGISSGVFTMDTSVGNWTRYQATWNSGAATVANLCLSDLNIVGSGNDFAVDDILFQQICTTTDSTYISVRTGDTTSKSSDTTVCITEQSIPLIAPSGDSYQWSTGSVNQTIVVGISGVYWVNVLGGCDSLQSDTFRVSIHPNPTVTLRSDTTICFGDSLTLGSAEPPFITYLWSNGSKDSSIFVSDSGWYWLTVSNSGCKATDSMRLSLIFKPKPFSLGDDTTLCTGEEMILINYTDSTLWSNNNKGPAIKVDQTGTYWASVSNVCGTVTDTINVKVDQCDIWFPSAFTPNGDNLNDIARAGGTLQFYTDFTLAIYNRWGQRVFYTNDIYSGWDGKFNGVPQGLGTYFYMMFYSLHGQKHMIKGDLTLIR